MRKGAAKMQQLWLGSSVPHILIDSTPSKLLFSSPEEEKKAMMLADVFAVHDSAFKKNFTDRFLKKLT